MAGIRPIETKYNGYRFRSRLEARWAVFFDALGVKYDYEPEGFCLPGAGSYLPDFWLPEADCWAEVKPDLPSPEEEVRVKALARHTGKQVFLLIGSPDQSGYGPIKALAYSWCALRAEDIAIFRSEPDEYGGLGRVEQMARDGGRVFRQRLLTFADVFPQGPDHGTCAAAIAIARSARFEHGETPCVRPLLPAFAGIVFGSGLEARWAAFFHLAGWEWEYRPLVVSGWSPDFRVRFLCGHSECPSHHELLVGVKSVSDLSGFDGHPCLRYPYGHAEEESIPADASAAFGNGPRVTYWEMGHGAGGGEETVEGWVEGDVDVLWAEAGRLVRYLPSARR